MNNEQSPKIKVEDAIKHFGSGAELARVLNISPQAITSWGEFIPELRAYKLRDLFPREFKILSAEKAA